MTAPDDPTDDPTDDPVEDLPSRVRAALTGPDGPLHRVLRELGWTPPTPLPAGSRLPSTGDLLDLIAAGCSVHEAADRLQLPVEVLRDELVALRRAHGLSSTAAVVRTRRGGH